MKKVALIAILVLLVSETFAEELPLPQRFAEKSGRSAFHPAAANFVRNRWLNSYASSCIISDTPYSLLWEALFSEVKGSDAKGEIIITGVDFPSGELTFDQPMSSNKACGLSAVYTLRRLNPLQTRLEIKLTVNRMAVVQDVDAAIAFAEIMDIAGKAKDYVPKKRVIPELPAPGMLYTAVCPKGVLGSFRHGERVTGYFFNQRLMDVHKEGTGPDKNYNTNKPLLHAGIDIATEKMSKIYPCADGQVADVIDNPNDDGWRALGFAVLVEHSNNNERVYSYYGNMVKKPFVWKGQKVLRGDTILGLAGSTGDESDENQVHFEIRKFKTMTYPEWESWYGVVDSPEAEKERTRQLKAEWYNPQEYVFAKEKEEEPAATPLPEVAKKKVSPDAIAPPMPPEPVQRKPALPRFSFKIAAHIDDDSSKNASVMGNGDGVVQKGEAFDLVVVVLNENNPNVKDVRVSIILPGGKAFKAYSDLVFSVSNLVPSVSATNRISMAVAVDAEFNERSFCLIELKDAQTNLLSNLEVNIPVAVDK